MAHWCELSFAGTTLPGGPQSCWGSTEEAAAGWGQKELAELHLHSLTWAAVFSAPGCARQTSSSSTLRQCLQHKEGEERRGWGGVRHPKAPRHPQSTPLFLPTPGWGLGRP